MRIAKGTLVVFEVGDDSDRIVVEVGKALHDFDTGALLLTFFFEEYPEYKPGDRPIPFGLFFRWLARHKHVRLLQPSVVWNLGEAEDLDYPES